MTCSEQLNVKVATYIIIKCRNRYLKYIQVYPVDIYVYVEHNLYQEFGEA